MSQGPVHSPGVALTVPGSVVWPGLAGPERPGHSQGPVRSPRVARTILGVERTDPSEARLRRSAYGVYVLAYIKEWRMLLLLLQCGFCLGFCSLLRRWVWGVFVTWVDILTFAGCRFHRASPVLACAAEQCISYVADLRAV